MEDALPTTTRPRSVTLTLWGVFLLGVWNFGRALALTQEMDLQLELAVQPDPRFQIIMALIWGIIFMGFWWLIRKKRPFTRKLLPLTLLLYTLYELGLILIFAQHDLTRQGIWLNLCFYLVMTIFPFWALNRAPADDYFAVTTQTT